MRGEKQELHAQFAREIEAAHAQLSNRETELEQQHYRAMREIEEQHSKGMYQKHYEFCLQGSNVFLRAHYC